MSDPIPARMPQVSNQRFIQLYSPPGIKDPTTTISIDVLNDNEHYQNQLYTSIINGHLPEKTNDKLTYIVMYGIWNNFLKDKKDVLNPTVRNKILQIIEGNEWYGARLRGGRKTKRRKSRRTKRRKSRRTKRM